MVGRTAKDRVGIFADRGGIEMIAQLILNYCHHKYTKMRKKHPQYTIFYINGIKKDTGKYVMYSEMPDVIAAMKGI